MARNARLAAKIHQIATAAIRRQVEQRAKLAGVASPLTGTVTFVQRFGSALNLNVHFHILTTDGVFAPPTTASAKPRFEQLPPPTDDDIAELVDRIAKQAIKHLRKVGLLSEDGEEVALPVQDQALFDEHDAHVPAVRASVLGKIAFGPRAGLSVRRVGNGFGYHEEVGLVTSAKCASANGFTVHAQTHCGAHQRDRLSALVSYGARPPLATARLTETETGDLLYKLKRAWSDGSTAILLSPQELLEKISALVPAAHFHMVRYTGIFSSHSKWRPQIIVRPEVKKGFRKTEGDDGKQLAKNSKWAQLLARVFKVDVGHCPKCGAEMRLVADVQDPAGVARYLRHIGLAAHPPPIAAARSSSGLYDYEPT